MITNKDIRVENGSLILNGDPYPLDGQSPEAIMQIVEDNSDSTPTENSAKPVKSGGVFAANKDITDTIGDITKTGVTGASVAAQLETLADDIIAEYIEDESISTSIASLTFGSYNIDCNKQGFVPIAIGEIYYGGDSALLLSRYVINKTNNIATVFFYNITSNAFTPSKISLKVIYKKA